MTLFEQANKCKTQQVHVSMPACVACRQHEPQTMAPLLNTLISRIVLGETKKNKKGELPRPSSIAFSEGDFPGSYHQLLHSATHSPVRGTSAVSSPSGGKSLQPATSSSGQLQASPPPAASADTGSKQQTSLSDSLQDKSEGESQQASTSGPDANHAKHANAASHPGLAQSNSQHHEEDQSRQLPGSSELDGQKEPGNRSVGQANGSRSSEEHFAQSRGAQVLQHHREAADVNTEPRELSNGDNNSGTRSAGMEQKETQHGSDNNEQEIVEAETLLGNRDDLTG